MRNACGVDPPVRGRGLVLKGRGVRFAVAADAVLTIDAPPPPMAAQVAEALGAGNARAGAECLRTPDAPVMCEILCALNV
jgi:hypothetical protein